MKIYNIGQVLEYKEDVEVEKALGTKETIKKGTKVFIGADRNGKFAHYLNGNIQPIGNNAEVKGYSVTGLAMWIYEYVSRRMPIDEMLEDYENTPLDLMREIADALEEIGMYNHEGNRS